MYPSLINSKNVKPLSLYLLAIFTTNLILCSSIVFFAFKSPFLYLWNNSVNSSIDNNSQLYNSWKNKFCISTSELLSDFFAFFVSSTLEEL